MNTQDTGKKTIRLQLMISATEVKAIDDYRHDRRIRTFAEAVRRLVKEGLKSEASDDGSIEIGSARYEATATLQSERESSSNSRGDA